MLSKRVGGYVFWVCFISLAILNSPTEFLFVGHNVYDPLKSGLQTLTRENFILFIVQYVNLFNYICKK